METIEELEKEIAKKREKVFDLYKDLWQIQLQLANLLDKKPTDSAR